MKRNVPLISAILFAALVTTACGESDKVRSSNTSRVSATSEDASTQHSDIVVPPKEYYDALLADRMLALDQGALNVHTEQVLWLNFEGATVAKGYGRDASFIVCSKTATIPRSGYTAADQAKMVAQVAQYFSNAGVSIAITYEKPKSGDYTTMHIGGSYSALGCGASGSTLGIAPYDVDNANPNDVGFAFLPGGNNLTIQALTIAHEAGHTFGLDHTNNGKDIMYPSVSTQETGFGIGIAEGSRKSQDGPLMLQKNVGAGFASVTGNPVPPTTTIPTPAPTPPPSNPNLPNVPDNNPGIAGLPGIPALGGLLQIFSQLSPNITSSFGNLLPILSNLPAGTNISDPNALLSALTILQNGATKQNGGQFDLGNLLGSLTGSQSAGIGSSLFGVLGLATGNPASIAGTLAPIVVPFVSTASGNNNSATPCDMTALMGMSSVSNPGSLIALMPKYAQVIHVNAAGKQAQGLNDAVKLAVGQTYVSLAKNPSP